MSKKFIGILILLSITVFLVVFTVSKISQPCPTYTNQPRQLRQTYINQPSPTQKENKCVVYCPGQEFSNLWGKIIYITDIPIMIGKIYNLYSPTDYHKNDIKTLEIGQNKGECFINGSKNPYTGYINPLCYNGILVSPDEKIIYGFSIYLADPCDLTIFDAVNHSTIPIKDMLLGEDEDLVDDSSINFVFLGPSYNSYLRDKNRFSSTQSCRQVDFKCNGI